MAAPNAPNPYHRGELLPTVRVDDDGNELGGQDRIIAQGDAHERYRIESKRASRNLTNDFNAEDPNRYNNAPSTPTKGGSRKKKHGGADSGNDENYTTPPTSPQKLATPGAPVRQQSNNLNRNLGQVPRVLFPTGQRGGPDRRQRGGPAQGGTRHRSKRMRGKKTKRTKRSHKKTRRTHKKSKSHRKRR